ncbi:hypothetical protein KBD71_00650 [Candidatus Woesebacteria bacterium]|nr:hypothetical protein [Candidatus Woesebacteria bacterium]
MTSRILKENGLRSDENLVVRMRSILLQDSTWRAVTDLQFILALNAQLGLREDYFTVSERIINAPISTDILRFLFHPILKTYLASTDDEILQMPGIEESDLLLIDSAVRMLQSQRD